MIITLHCCLCSAQADIKVPLPKGWRHRIGGMDEEQDAYCPKHAPIEAFAKAQCPGCVSGWGECPLFDSFAYSGRRRTITEADHATLKSGFCPKRTNGTISVQRGKVTGRQFRPSTQVEIGHIYTRRKNEK